MGREIVFIKDYHDQPHGGTSRPNLKGKVRRIAGVIVDADLGRIDVLPEGCRTYAVLESLDYPKEPEVTLKGLLHAND